MKSSDSGSTRSPDGGGAGDRVRRVVTSQNPRVLIVRLGAIGDALRVLPAVRRLRIEFPGATIGWAVEQWVLPLLDGNPNVDRFHVLDRRRLESGVRQAGAEFSRLCAEVRAAGYDVVLDFHGRLKSGLVSRWSGVRSRVGFARGDSTEGNWLFNNVHVRLEDRWESRVLRFLHLLRPLGIEAGFEPGETGVFVDPETRERAAAWYAQAGRPAVAAYPGTSALRVYCRWPGEKWVELLRELAAGGVQTTVFWGPADEDMARTVVAEAGNGVELAPRTTLPEMMAALAGFRVFVGSNSGAMHMAWLQGVPTAVFVGPVRPRTDAPLAPVSSRVLWRGDLYDPRRRRKEQPQVVRDVPVPEVLEAVRGLLDETGG